MNLEKVSESLTELSLAMIKSADLSYKLAADIAESVREIASYEASRNKWISIYDQLPPKGEVILTLDGDGDMDISALVYDESKVKKEDGSINIMSVLYWMYLPKLSEEYKPNSNMQLGV